MPAFAAVLAAGFKLLQGPLRAILGGANNVLSIRSQFSPKDVDRAARFIAALVGAATSFSLLNGPAKGPNVRSEYGKTVAFDMEFSDDEDDFVNTKKKAKRSRIPPGMPPVPFEDSAETHGVLSIKGMPLAGQTMDFTVFAFIRAMDVLFQLPRSASQPPTNRVSAFVRKTGTPTLFILASAVIMNAWFYTPQRLPDSYVKWIDKIAELDERLMYCLRQLRYGNFVYGKDTGMAPVLGTMAKDCGLPEEYGDPAKTIPCPCELVHHGYSKSCEKHALWRFYRGWRKALGVYLPLQLLILQRRIRHQRCGRGMAVLEAVRNASRNSAFLGAFVSLTYYGICLGRTRIGPKLFPHIPPSQWDGGLAMLWGCFLCGFSVLLENARRQTELMLFVVPRAVAVWFPRRYPKDVSSSSPRSGVRV